MPKQVRHDRNKNMITIIHGDDIVVSRKKLTDLTASFKDGEVLHFQGEGTSITDVVQVFESQSLFDRKRLVVLERFIETKDKELIASIVNHLKKELSHDVIFWEPKEIKKELLALLPKESEVFFYKQDQLLFRFLDSIRPGNTKEMLLLAYQVRKSEADELLLHMLVRQFRLLLGTSSKASIAEVKRLAPWQRGKLERQAGLFGKERLVLLYKRLFQLERGAKTGNNALPLTGAIDLFLTTV